MGTKKPNGKNKKPSPKNNRKQNKKKPQK